MITINDLVYELTDPKHVGIVAKVWDDANLTRVRVRWHAGYATDHYVNELKEVTPHEIENIKREAQKCGE